MLGRFFRIDDAARRAHDERPRQPGRLRPRREGTEVARAQRAEIRVGGRRRSALVLAKLGGDLVRGDDVGVRQAPPQLLCDRRLVSRVAEREQRADCDRLGADLRQRVELEGDEHSVRAHALAHAVAVLQSYERPGMLGTEPVQVRAVLAAQVEEMLEARRGDEGRPGALPLEQRIRRNRRPVREALDILTADGGRGSEHRLLLLRSGRHLCGHHTIAVEQHGVGERPADVDAENRHRAMLQRPPPKAARRSTLHNSATCVHNTQMTKYERQGAILRLVQERPIATQGELVDALREHGIDAVQTTVSRDIHQLGLVKTRAEDGRLVYALPGAADLDRLGAPDDRAQALGAVHRAHRRARRREDAGRIRDATRRRHGRSCPPGCRRNDRR